MASNTSKTPTDRITKEILAAAVANQKEVDAGKVAVESFELSSGAKFGENYSTVVKRVDVKAVVDGELTETCFMVKCQDVGSKHSVFEAEVKFYGSLVKELQTLRKEAGLPPLRIPAAYYLSAEEGVIVLENLKAQGFDTKAISVQGLEPRVVEDLLVTLGAFHATSYHFMSRYPGGKEQLKRDRPWLDQGTFYEVNGGEEASKRVALYLSVFSRLLGSEDGGNRPDLAEKLDLQLGCFYQKAQQSAKPECGSFTTIVHGDFRTSNFLFKGAAEEIGIIDFQFPTIANPMADLQHFLCSSVHPAHRKDHRDKWIGRYHSSITKTLVAFGHPEATYALEDVRNDYEHAKYHGFITGCISLLPVLIRETTEAGKLLAKGGDSSATVAEVQKQVGAFVAALANSAKATPGFVQRLVGLVDMAVQDGTL